MDEFISEDDLKSFDGWLRYQAIDATGDHARGISDVAAHLRGSEAAQRRESQSGIDEASAGPR